jgi:SAM-dependent methyltransferase
VSDDRASSYGDTHAAVYDRIYGTRFAPQAAVNALAAAAGSGAVLELGVGTGRLAIPLAARGLAVDGIEASPAMIERLRAQPGGDSVGVHRVGLADFDLPRRDYTVEVCAVSTLFMLTHADQHSAVRAAARHLGPGGRLFVEAFRPDPGRFDSDGQRVETRTPAVGTHVVRSLHDPVARSIRIRHELGDGPGAGDGDGDGVQGFEVTLYYATLEELDVMASQAGLRLVDRWHDWTGVPARRDSTDPISVYEK